MAEGARGWEREGGLKFGGLKFGVLKLGLLRGAVAWKLPFGIIWFD